MISIAMATYNGERFLKKQLDSILAQTYQDIELIICDDCSADHTYDILTSYAKKDSRIKIYANTENLGFKKNFEKAISLCTGEYIALADQDDIWPAEKLETELSKLGQYDLVCTNASLIDANGTSMQMTMMDILDIDFVPDDQEQLLIHLLEANIAQGATILAKSSFLRTCLPIPEEFEYHDRWFAIQACLHSGLTYISEPLLLYRQHQSQHSDNKKKDRWKIATRINGQSLKQDIQKRINTHIAAYTAIIKSIDNNIPPRKRKCVIDRITFEEHQIKKDLYTIQYLYKNYEALFLKKGKIKKYLFCLRKLAGLLRRPK